MALQLSDWQARSARRPQGAPGAVTDIGASVSANALARRTAFACPSLPAGPLWINLPGCARPRAAHLGTVRSDEPSRGISTQRRVHCQPGPGESPCCASCLGFEGRKRVGASRRTYTWF